MLNECSPCVRQHVTLMGVHPLDLGRPRCHACVGEVTIPYEVKEEELRPVPVRCAARREIAFDVEAFIQQATSFPNGANDDAVDACSQYLNEAYLVGGGAT